MMCVPDTQNTLLDATDLRVKKILVDPGKKSSQPHKTQKRKCSLSINVYDRLVCKNIPFPRSLFVPFYLVEMAMI